MDRFKFLISFIILTLPSKVLSEVGFRDLKVGSSKNLILQHCERQSGYFKCYNFDDLNFYFKDVQSKSPKFFHFKGQGYRHLVVGENESIIEQYCKMKIQFIRPFWTCYDNNEITFQFVLKDKKLKRVDLSYTNKIDEITIDIGPIFQSGLNQVFEDTTTQYLKIRNSLNEKYEEEWTFTDRDKKLFSVNEKNSLWLSYNRGQVFLEIRRVDQSSNLRLLVHYHSLQDGLKLSRKRRPQQTSKVTDF